VFSVFSGGIRLASRSLWEGRRRLTVVARRSLWCPIFLLLLVGDGGWSQAWAQTASPPTNPTGQGRTATAQQSPPALGEGLERIKNGLDTPIKLKIDDGKIRFYAETVARGRPSFKDLTVNFDLRHGPVPGAGMTHDEFLRMVTPQLMYGSAGIKPLETLEWGLVNHVGWWAIRKLYKELSEATDANRIKAIREQIDRELAALRGK